MMIEPARVRERCTADEWRAKGEELFGPDMMQWRFVCPACGHVASAADWRDAGASAAAVGFSCVGRWKGAKQQAFAPGDGPCTYAGGGLFAINPLTVVEENGSVYHMFAFGPGGGK